MSVRPKKDGGPAGPFDLERLRKNWERARPVDAPRELRGGRGPSEPARPLTLPARFAEVAEPRDTYPVGRELLTRARPLAVSELRDRAVVLQAFFDQADTVLERMATAVPAAPGGGPDKALEAMRLELQGKLDDIEDLANALTQTHP